MVVNFDFHPGHEYPVELYQFETEADSVTQTYLVRVIMPAPEDVMILPGMTGTVTLYEPQSEKGSGAGYAVPIDAVPIDGQGKYHVWLIRTESDGTHSVHRVDVKVGDMVHDDILILEGVKQGDRIATAGVHLLREGQQVRLLDSKKGA